MVPTLSSAEPAEAAFTYREQAPPPALAPWVRCLWELTVQGEGAGRAHMTAECTRLAGRSPGHPGRRGPGYLVRPAGLLSAHQAARPA
jgi:hypothetical protein